MMLRYKLYNPNRFMVPVMLKDKEHGSFTQKNLLPRASMEITGDQVSDSVKNLTSAPRNVLRMTRIEEKKDKPSSSVQKPVQQQAVQQKPAENKPADKNAAKPADKKNGGGK